MPVIIIVAICMSKGGGGAMSCSECWERNVPSSHHVEVWCKTQNWVTRNIPCVSREGEGRGGRGGGGV